MLKIKDDNAIQLTRGDTAVLQIQIVNDLLNEDYQIKESDTLRLTIKESTRSVENLVQKVIVGNNTFRIKSSDTSYLKFGTYKYDVELTTADGDVYTVIPVSNFEVMPEVTW